jgi:hypothetical protein
MTSGWLFLLLGLAIILHLKVAIIVKIILAVAWTTDCVWGLTRQGGGNARVRRILINVRGTVEGLDSSGKLHELQLLKGSAVLRHCGWLRLRFADGLHYVELISSFDCPKSTWRRLQLIWRHAV